MSTNCFRRGLLLGLGLLALALAQAAAAQVAPADSVRRLVPPHVLLKAGLRLTHFSYSPGSQAWRVVVPFSLGAEYRLAPRFSVYSQLEADLQASRATNGRRRQATAVPSTSLALGLRYYYGQPAQGKLPRSNSLYGSYLACSFLPMLTGTTRYGSPHSSSITGIFQPFGVLQVWTSIGCPDTAAIVICSSTDRTAARRSPADLGHCWQ